jgi:hypothetical protein
MSVSVRHHHLDPYALPWVSDWIKLADLTGDRQWIEKALAIWRNGGQLVSDGTLEINERIRPIVCRLQQADADKEIRKAMDVEDDVTEHFRIEEQIRQIKLEKKDMIISEKEVEFACERAEKETLLAELAALKAHLQTGKK